MIWREKLRILITEYNPAVEEKDWIINCILVDSVQMIKHLKKKSTLRVSKVHEDN